jgi:hypothetical protein
VSFEGVSFEGVSFEGVSFEGGNSNLWTRAGILR